MVLDPKLVKIGFKLIKIMSPSIISRKSANTILSFIFNPYMKNFRCFKCSRFLFQQTNPTHPGVFINKSHDIFISKGICNMHEATQIKVYQLSLYMFSRSGIMKRLLVVFTKETCFTLLQVPWNCKKNRNIIFIQHMKTIIIDVPKSIMPQDIG